MKETIIIGAGVMGLSIARKLEQSNRRIRILDRCERGKNASHAAGGMLGAQNEFHEPAPLFELARESRAMMSVLTDELIDETGIDIEHQKYGLIKIATNREDIDKLIAQYEFLKEQDENIHLLSNEQCSHYFTLLRNIQHKAMFIPDDGQVNTGLYMQALMESVLKRKIELITRIEVISIDYSDNQYVIHTNKDSFYADELIICAGAWSGRLLQQMGYEIETHPVKGEVKLVQSDQPLLKETIFNVNGCYIVPKSNDTYLIGATSEFDKWTTDNTEDNLFWLDEQSQLLLPELKKASLIKTWTGIRPITPNAIPYMGEINRQLYVSTGHYRNGILLSPLIGKYMAQMIDGDHKVKAKLAPFAPKILQQHNNG